MLHTGDATSVERNSNDATGASEILHTGDATSVERNSNDATGALESLHTGDATSVERKSNDVTSASENILHTGDPTSVERNSNEATGASEILHTGDATGVERNSNDATGASEILHTGDAASVERNSNDASGGRHTSVCEAFLTDTMSVGRNLNDASGSGPTSACETCLTGNHVPVECVAASIVLSDATSVEHDRHHVLGSGLTSASEILRHDAMSVEHRLNDASGSGPMRACESSATAELCSAGACDTIQATTLAALPRRPMKKYKFLLPGTLDTCRHGECRELRRQLTASKKLTCAVCAFDHAQRVCSSAFCDAPIVFVRGWHGGWEFKVLGNFVHDPPDASRGEALRCVPCHSSFVGPGNLA
jgi:hypothetical protein